MTSRPHDALVRDVFAHPEHARGELQHLLPAALSARIDWSTLELVPGSFVDEKLRDHLSDLLFRVKLDGRDSYIYLLFEHQSTVDELMVFRELEYAVRLWRDWLEDHPGATRLPVVIPLLLSHAPSGWTAATRFEDVLDVDLDTRALVQEFVPRFRVLVDDLTAETDEALRSRSMTALGRLALWCLKTARSPVELVSGVRRWGSLLRAVREAPHGMAAWALICRYVMTVHDAPAERVLPALGSVLEAKQRREMATIAEQLIEKGVQKGLQKGLRTGRREGRKEGLQEGRQEGQRELLLRQLERRFGPLPAEARARVEHAGAADLERWADRVLTEPTLAAVLGDAP